MWIELTPAGKYKYVEEYTDYMTGKKKRVSTTLEKNTAAAKRTAAEVLRKKIDQKLQAPALAQDPDLTLSQLVEKYQLYQQKTVKESTYRRNCYQCKALIKILGGDVIVNRLTANYIKERFLLSGESPSRLNERRIRLFALLNWAYENDYLADVGFLKKCKPFQEKVTHREKIQDKYLEPDEANTLLESMDNKKWVLLTQFLILSGLRIGEALALNKQDIDFSGNVIHVTKTYDANNKVITTPKTLCSIRDVYIQPDLEPICKKILLNTRLENMAYGNRSDLFLCNRNGHPVNPFSYNKYLREHAQKAIGRSITAHALRHTHASLLLANGISIESIARRLGHENSKVTREIYLHITEQLVQRDNEQIKKAHLVNFS